MEPQVEKAFEIANFMTTLASQKRILKEDYEQTLLCYHNGGTFKATRELIAFISSLKTDHFVVVDENQIPIMITNIPEFLDKVLAQHTEANNSYFSQYQRLIKSKKIESLVE